MKLSHAFLLSCVLLVAFPSHLQADEAAPKKFTVGMILPLSGGLADFGAALRHGFELAEEDYPEEFSRIRLVYEDSQFDEKKALNSFYALEQRGGVNLYHVWGVSPNASVLPVANAKRRPVVAETSMLSAARGRPYVVIASRTGRDAAERLVEGFERRGWKSVGLVITQIPYYTDIAEALAEFGKKKGIRIERFGEVAPSDQDFRSLLAKAKQKDLDAFGPLLLGDQIISFCKQAAAVQYSKPMFGAHIHNSVELLSQCLPMSEGALFPGVIVRKEFRDRYAARFGNDQRIDSAAGSYETAKMIAELFGKPGSAELTPEEVVARFKSIVRPESTIGAFKYSESDEGGKAIRFNEIVLAFNRGNVVPFSHASK